MSIHARRTSIRVGLLGAALSVAACLPLPITHTAQVTPMVTGTLHRSDGSPIVGAPVATSDDDDDVACRRSQARGLTDAAGRFHLPAASVRRRIFWVTMIESFGAAWYWLCAGAADSTRGPLLLRRVQIDGYVRGDTVSCLTWVWQSEQRLTCNAPRTKHIFSDGDWTAGPTRGFYRAILAEDAQGGYEARAFVQWIEPLAGGRATVRAIAELPTGEGVVSHRGVRFGIRDARWYAAVISVKRTTSGKERQLTFELGPPGQVRRLPDR